MEWILAKLGLQVGSWAGYSVLGIVVAYGFKKIPNNWLRAVFGKFMLGAGVFVTLGLSKYKYTKKFWKKTIEPWFIDFLDNVWIYGWKQFRVGLRSDDGDEEEKEKKD